MKLLVFKQIILIYFISFSFSIAAQNDTVFWYENDSIQEWQIQDDVFIFRNVLHTEFHVEEDSNLILFRYFRKDKPDKLNVVDFHPNSTLSQRIYWKQLVSNHPLFETCFPAITLNNELNCSKGNWLATDDLIAVQFHENFYFDERYSDFTGIYGLMLQNQEAVSASVNFNPVFIFKWNLDRHIADNTIDLCRILHENESEIVKEAIPNKIVAFKPLPDKFTGIHQYNDTESSFYISVFPDRRILAAFKNNEMQFAQSEFSILSALGQSVINIENAFSVENKCFLSLSEIPPGIYFGVVTFKGSPDYFIKKFIIK
jgi:hypothetical protein